MIDLIAEIGQNHCGDIKIIEKMIISAAKNGADYAKFQTWRVNKLKPGIWDSDGRREFYEKIELSDSMYQDIIKICQDNNVRFLTSVFCQEDLDFVRTFSNVVKIPSAECANLELVTKAVETFDTVYISIGGSTYPEYSKWLAIPNVVIMHCVSSYPCVPEDVNLARLKFFISKGYKCGYSGHYFGIYDALAAICIGASVVEKHFTIDRSLDGRDNKFSLLPDEFVRIKEFSKEYDKMSTMKGFDYQDCELEIRNCHRGRWTNSNYDTVAFCYNKMQK